MTQNLYRKRQLCRAEYFNDKKFCEGKNGFNFYDCDLFTEYDGQNCGDFGKKK